RGGGFGHRRRFDAAQLLAGAVPLAGGRRRRGGSRGRVRRLVRGPRVRRQRHLVDHAHAADVRPLRAPDAGRAQRGGIPGEHVLVLRPVLLPPRAAAEAAPETGEAAPEPGLAGLAAEAAEPATKAPDATL